MLEERINVLIQSIDCLTAVINRLWDEKDNIRGIKAPPISADPPKVKTKKETKTKKTETKKETKTPTDIPAVKDLEAMCLDIIREKGPTFKKKIKNTIAAHGGEMIADCPTENLVVLKKALEALL